MLRRSRCVQAICRSRAVVRPSRTSTASRSRCVRSPAPPHPGSWRCHVTPPPSSRATSTARTWSRRRAACSSSRGSTTSSCRCWAPAAGRACCGCTTATARGVPADSSSVRRPSLHAVYTLQIRYDTIRDAILTCARKPTYVSLIYRTETDN